MTLAEIAALLPTAHAFARPASLREILASAASLELSGKSISIKLCLRTLGTEAR